MAAESTAEISTENPAYSPANQADGALATVPVAQRAKRLLAQGITLARRRSLAQAIARFTQALALPTHDLLAVTIKSYYHRGCALSRMGRYEAAIADFTQAIQGVAGQDEADIADDLTKLTAVANHFSIQKLAEIYIHRGSAYRHTESYLQAAVDLNQAVELSGGSAQSYGARGLLRLDIHDQEGAIADFSQALTIHPTFSQCYLWRGFAWLRSGQYQMAAEDLSHAIAAIPSCAEAYNHRGVALFYLTDFVAAKADFDQAIRLDREFVEAYNNRGNLLQLMGEPLAAAADYDRAIALNPYLAEIYFNRAATAPTELSPTATAEPAIDPVVNPADDYDQTAGLALDNAAFYRHRGQVRFQQGHVSAAIADYSSALSLTPTAFAYYRRGVAYQTLNQLDLAQADFDAAIALSPDYGEAYCDRAHLRLGHNDLAGALTDINQALVLSDEAKHPAIYATRCMIHFCLNQPKPALADFEQLVQLFSRASSGAGSGASSGAGSGA